MLDALITALDQLVDAVSADWTAHAALSGIADAWPPERVREAMIDLAIGLPDLPGYIHPEHTPGQLRLLGAWSL